MAKTLYCWRCQMDLPMLDEAEWRQVLPGFQTAGALVAKSGATFREAKDHVYGQAALDRYFAITGFRETNPNALWHHRLSAFGPPCTKCGKPLRTPKARLCAACGAARD